MYDKFRARAEAVSAGVHRFAAGAQAIRFVLELLRAEGVSAGPGRQAAWAGGPCLAGIDRAALARDLPGLRFDVTRELATTSLVGVSEMDFAIADTGTLAQAADAVEGRLVSMLPPVHVALVPTNRLVPDVAALFARLSPAQTRYLALITGPSRTADIERVLTIGVHGPKRLVIVFADDLAGRS